jgi:peptide/nickel transport system permease protein
MTSMRRALVQYAESRLAIAALFVFGLAAMLALFAPLIAPQNPHDLASLNLLDSRLPPGSRGTDGMFFLLGTDDQGRDVASAILFGLRISIGVALVSGVIAIVLGSTAGIVAAFFGGRVDVTIMRVVDIQLAFPPFLIALILLAVFGAGIGKIIVALVAVQWAYYARTVRSAALVERQREYVQAAQCLGFGRLRIMFGHILPNCAAPLVVVATVEVASAIALEAALSFLGAGLPITEPSLGLLIANGYSMMLSGDYWLSVYPGLVLLILVASVNLTGDQLRNVLNPRYVP